MISKKCTDDNVKFLIDWCSFTVSLLYLNLDSDRSFQSIADECLEVFHLCGYDYQVGKGRHGWDVCYSAAGISLCVGGRDDVWIELSGSGCRAFETLNPDWTWEKYIKYIQDTFPAVHFSRLDVACDTFGLLDMDKIVKCTFAGKYISRWRTPHCDYGVGIAIAYFGSAKSDFLCRIYDKTKERLAKGKVSSDLVPEHWVRIEFQFRNKAIKSFLREWLASGNISMVFLGILKNQLVFTQGVPDRCNKNQKRVKIAPWWSKLLGDAGRIKMAYCGGMEYNLESLHKYVVIQAGSSIQTYAKLYGKDKLMKLVDERPLNDKQVDLIRKWDNGQLDQFKHKPKYEDTKTYVCFACGYVGTSEDFIFYGENSRCWCRACARRV